MSWPAPSPALATTFLCVEAGTHEWGFASSSVARVLTAREWAGRPAAELGPRPARDGRGADEARVVVLSTSGGEAPVRVAGAMQVREFEPSQVYALPPLVAARARAVTAVAWVEGCPPVLVVDPDALQRSENRT